jgi:diguanylate cyclase
MISNKRQSDSATNRELYSTYIGSDSVDREVANDVSQQLASVMNDAKGFLSLAIADNRLQMQAIGGVADQAESGTNPRLLVESLVRELSKAVTRAAKLEANFDDGNWATTRRPVVGYRSFQEIQR